MQTEVQLNPFETHSFIRDFIESLVERARQGSTRERVFFVAEILSIVISSIYLLYSVTVPLYHDLYYKDYYLNECLLLLICTGLVIIFSSIRLASSVLDNRTLGLKCSVIPILLYVVVMLISYNSQAYISGHGMMPPNNLVHVEFKYGCCGWTTNVVEHCGSQLKSAVTCYDRLVIPLMMFYKHNMWRCMVLFVYESIITIGLYFFSHDDFIESQYDWPGHEE
ncbi:Uncharacterized protein QTN25_000163 [Entamoeba marina]